MEVFLYGDRTFVCGCHLAPHNLHACGRRKGSIGSSWPLVLSLCICYPWLAAGMGRFGHSPPSGDLDHRFAELGMGTFLRGSGAEKGNELDVYLMKDK